MIHLSPIFIQTFKLFEKLAVQDRERVMKLAEEARAVPTVVEEIEVRSQPEVEEPAETAQESRSVASSTDAVPAGAGSANGNEVESEESEQPTAVPTPTAPSAQSAPSASAQGAASDSSAAEP